MLKSSEESYFQLIPFIPDVTYQSGPSWPGRQYPAAKSVPPTHASSHEVAVLRHSRTCLIEVEVPRQNPAPISRAANGCSCESLSFTTWEKAASVEAREPVYVMLAPSLDGSERAVSNAPPPGAAAS